ncbi:hypothetical protein SOVF_042130 [Spinacia oleracea]|uniref:Cold-regulated 413 inner membrane protein 2, chloroplastic n=1 Tax=Spinacia oleracea TaxID=3562 RepID=A0A9R0JYU0_SPIOL|nr:cold-regulated 413 inner membrane protein 2, chloroplastic-like [Spinacia oleracea]KNA21561.1 hypothetical protein SOVF_042130 [Spinacia oleracea]
MQSQCLSLCSSPRLFAAVAPPKAVFSSLQQRPSHFSCPSSVNFNPLRLSLNHQNLTLKNRSKRSSMVVSNSLSSIISPRNLPWISAVSTAILMLVKGTPIHKSFLVPLFALQAPASVIAWMQGEYGAWAASLALLARLFFSLPGELELPFLTLVLVIVAPRQAMNLRGTQAGAIISLTIAAFLAFQHFTNTGGLQKSFEQVSIVATLAIICITVVPGLLLI